METGLVGGASVRGLGVEAGQGELPNGSSETFLVFFPAIAPVPRDVSLSGVPWGDRTGILDRRRIPIVPTTRFEVSKIGSTVIE